MHAGRHGRRVPNHRVSRSQRSGPALAHGTLTRSHTGRYRPVVDTSLSVQSGSRSALLAACLPFSRCPPRRRRRTGIAPLYCCAHRPARECAPRGRLLETGPPTLSLRWPPTRVAAAVGGWHDGARTNELAAVGSNVDHAGFARAAEGCCARRQADEQKDDEEDERDRTRVLLGLPLAALW